MRGRKDEEWRPAIELAFTRKFAVVVGKDLYPEALQIYMKEFSRDSLKESLVDPDRALSRQSVVHPQSLANKLECRDPVAQAVVHELFGNVVCVTSVEELRQHNDAIMSDGFRMRGLFAERPRRYDNRPCIGAKGLERLKALAA
jgi:chromosome segregation ATPase